MHGNIHSRGENTACWFSEKNETRGTGELERRALHRLRLQTTLFPANGSPLIKPNRMASMSAQFVTTPRVEFAETDAAGIVHFANFYRYMEEAEHQFFRSLGLSIMEEQPDGSHVTWPRVFAQCTFEASARFEDELEIRLDIVEKGVKTLTLSVEFHLGETRLAYGVLKTVCCRLQPGERMRSMEIPDHYHDKLTVSTHKPLAADDTKESVR